jgi:hypothetical protein
MKPEKERQTAFTAKFYERIICGIIPASVVVFYALVIRVRLDIGIWPRYGHPDPMQSAFIYHAIIAGIILLLALLSPFAVICFWMFCSLKKNLLLKKEKWLFTTLFLLLYFA